ncbi:MAG: hypothetical protein NT164_03170 [Verrucomicrobiae bacterium]|nr:hypothetical protein [Verrucomicrobiae bacterium]
MIKYANKQEAAASEQSGIMDLLPHAAKVVGGGAMVTFAVATKGHLSPADIFFLLDLLSGPFNREVQHVKKNRKAT